MKKKALLAAVALAALMVPQVAGAEGFGLVEWSAQGTAMGGARMFAENDAAMIAYNPAAITKVENGAAAIHVTQISPHGRYDVYDPLGRKVEINNHNTINPGKSPSMYYVKKIGSKDWIGIGAFTRFGMLSEFEGSSIVSYSAKRSKMIGTSITPTYAHKFDKKWSTAVGAEINYVDLALDRNMGYPGVAKQHMKIQGDTWALGWNAAASYKFDDKNEVGVVYRSKISQNMHNADMHIAGIGSGYANARVVLPDQWTIGYNHKFNDKTRVELNALYTRWSTYEALNMDTTFGPRNEAKNWSNGWRYAIGVEHKISDKYNLLAGYSYDGSVMPSSTADFMIPTGNRKTIAIGTEYHDKHHTLAATFGYMFIGDKDITITPMPGYPSFKSHTRDNNAPIISVGYQYKF